MIFELDKIPEKHGERTAYIFGEEKRTYRELFENAEKISAMLKTGDSSPVAVYGGKIPAVMECILACLLAKRTYVPIDISMPKERKDKIIELSGATVLIDCSEKEPVLKSIESAVPSYKENNIAYIIFTSGSTGEPKGVPISYKNLDSFSKWITKLSPMNEIEHGAVLNHAVFSFDLSTATIYYSLFGGHTLLQLSDMNDFGAAFETISTNKPNLIIATPSFLRLLMLNKEFCNENYPFIKQMYFCGETLQRSIVKAIFERFPDARVINSYGPTETTCAVSAIEVTKEMLETEDILPVGEMSTAATEIEVIDGEIILSGESVFGGYVGFNFENCFFKQGQNCYRTGDLGFIQNGKLYCKGRFDSQIKYKGYRIELSDIEANISSLPGVSSSAVIAKRDENGEVKMIKAFVTGEVSSDEIRTVLKEKLPEYMIPKVIKILDKMPMNANGKIDRKELIKL